MSAFAFLRKLPWSFLFALALCAAAWGTKIALETQIGELTPFLLFFGAVMVATWNGGLGIGVISALVSALLVEYYFLPPLRSFHLNSAGWVQMGVFLIECFFMALLTARARLANDAFAAQAERQSALSELSQLALTRIDDLDFLFERTAQLCAQTLDAPRAAILELERPEAIFSNSTDETTGDFFCVRAAVAPSNPTNAIGEKRPVLANSPAENAVRTGFPIGNASGQITGNLSVPIGPVERYWGVLEIGDTEEQSVRMWSSEQMEWIRAVVGVLGVAIAGREARERVVQGETRYRSFVEQSSEAIWRFEMDEPIDMSLNRAQILELAWQNGFLAECNDAFAKMYGFERAQEMVGMRLWQIMNRDDERVRDFLLGLINDDFRVSDAESVEVGHDGQQHVLLSNLTGIVENGLLVRVWGTQRDVTAEREAERELKESENRFRSLFDAAPVPLGIGRGQRVLYVNHALCELLGYENPQALIGQPITDFVAPTERAEIRARAFSRAAGGQEPLIYESRVQKSDGSLFPARVEMAQIQLPEGGATLMFLFDLTAQKQADAAIAQLLDQGRDATERAQNLLEISFDLLRPRAPEDVANIAIERITETVGARGGVLVAPENTENPRSLETIGARGYPSGTVDRFPSIDVDSPHPIAHVYRARAPLWMDRAWDWVERFPSLRQTLPATGTKSIALLPLEAEGEVVSVMALSWSEPRVFDDESRLFLQTLANSCAQAMDRARLDAQTRDLARRQQESLALLNTLLDSAPVGFALFDSNERYVLLNNALAAINGKPISEHLGRTMREALHESAPEFERRLQKVWQTGVASGEFILSDGTNGENRSCLISLYPVRVEHVGPGASQILGVGAIVLDISERIRDEEEKTRLVIELEMERARLEEILLQMPSAVIIAEAPSGRFLLGNPQVEKVLGFSYKAVNSTGEYEYYNGYWPDGRQIQNDEWPMSRAINQGTIVKDEEFVVRTEGGNRVIRITAAPVRDRDGKITAGISIFDDITRRAREQAAQRFLANAGSVLIATLDDSTSHAPLANLCVPEVADWCIVAIPVGDGLLHNAEIAHVSGADAKDNVEIARRFAAQLASDAATPWDIASALSTGRAQLYSAHDIDYLRRRNTSATFTKLAEQMGVRSAIVAPLVARGRTVGLMIWITSDSGRTYDEHDLELASELAQRAALTADNARLFREAQQARDEAEAANLAKDEFLAVVSHELRTPLTPILGWLDLLRAPSMTDELRAQGYDVIERNARAQSQIVNDILDVSRITSGKLRLDRKPLDLTLLVRNAVESLRLTADEKNIELRLDLSEVGLASIDANRFQQVVWNLMSNSIKFTPPGGNIAISLRRENTGEMPTAMLEIADSGQGITPEFIGDVFEAFRQADSSSTRKAGGLGLGLAIVRHIVAMHDGQVSAHSEGEDRGATFRVEVPLLNADGKGENVENSELSSSLKNVSDARILLIDDEADTRETLARLLESHGARVRVAASASQALQVLDTFAPQLAISDIGMPTTDGYQLLAQLRVRFPELPAIALTAYATPADIERANAAGFQRHLAKPVETSALLKACGELLSDG